MCGAHGAVFHNRVGGDGARSGDMQICPKFVYEYFRGDNWVIIDDRE